MNQSQAISVYNGFYATADLSEYAGEWVAILDKKVVAHNKDLKALLKKTASMSLKVSPFVAKIPIKEILIW